MSDGVDLLDLPPELVEWIIGCLDNLEDLITLRGSCKSFYDIVETGLSRWLRSRPLGHSVELLTAAELAFVAGRCEGMLSLFKRYFERIEKVDLAMQCWWSSVLVCAYELT